MSLMPSYYTTTNTKKHKNRKKSKSLIAAEKEHKKFLERMGVRSRSSVGLEQQSSKLRVTGSSPVETTNLKEVGVGTQGGLINLSAADYRSRSGSIPDTSTISSSDNGIGYHPSMAKKEAKVYNGKRKLLGIATMHKSNLVPVFDKESAEDIAKMRRG